MHNTVLELFVHEYFLEDAILGKDYDRKRLFFILADLFCIPDRTAADLFDLTEREAVSVIETMDDFKRYKRIRQYHSLSGTDVGFSPEEERILSVKGNALKASERQRIRESGDMTESLIIFSLMKAGNSGNIAALRMLGILQCEGLVVDKDKTAGLKNLTRAARWADTPAILALFRYSDAKKSDLMSMLSAAVRNTPYQPLLSDVAKQYDLSEETTDSPEIALVRRTIQARKLDPDYCQPMCARVVYSEVIGIKDKERILFSEEKGILSETCDLPLKLICEEIRVDETAMDELHLKREEESAKIFHGLRRGKMRTFDAFRPMCLCSDSEYVLDAYVKVIARSMPDVYVNRIEMEELRECDFEPSKNHVFLRNLNENKTNVYLLVFKGDVREETIRQAMGVLNTSRRRRFQLTFPAVTLDLSSVLPICVCDKENAPRLKGVAEIIDLAPVRETERPGVIESMIREKSEAYALGEVSFSEEAIGHLSALPVEKASDILDRILVDHRREGEPFSLETDLIDPYLNRTANRQSSYGFWGTIK